MDAEYRTTGHTRQWMNNSAAPRLVRLLFPEAGILGRVLGRCLNSSAVGELLWPDPDGAPARHLPERVYHESSCGSVGFQD